MGWEGQSKVGFAKSIHLLIKKTTIMYTCELSIKSEWSIKRIIVAIKTKQMTKHQKCFCNHSGHMFIFFFIKTTF